MKNKFLTLMVAPILGAAFILEDANAQWQGAAGTTDYTSNIYRTGSVGIGITNPQGRLHVAAGEGDGIIIGSPNDNMGNNGGSYSIKFYGYRDINPNIITAKIAAERTNSCCNWMSQGTDLTFYTSQPSGTANSDISVERIRIKDYGTVGIGTSTPDQNVKLDVNGGIKSTTLTTANATGTVLVGSGNRSAISLSPVSGAIYHIDNNNGKLQLSHGSSINQNLLMVVDASNGAVGIGISNPTNRFEVSGGDSKFWGKMVIGNAVPTGITDYKLAVSGKVYCQEVNVTPATSWSDYVFKNDYKLATLEEVETHIKEKGHLKDVPSAEEVGKNGIKLGEMDATLLRKIEELTLYVIAQQKKINELENKIK